MKFVRVVSKKTAVLLQEGGLQLLNPSRQSIGHVRNSLAGLNLAVVQTQGEQLLETGVDLVVHGSIPRRDVTQLLQQTRAALDEVLLGILEALSKAGGSLGGLDGASLGVDGAGALHGGSRGGTGDSSLAASGLLLLDLTSARRGLRRAVALGGGIVVHTTHVVVKVPSPWESISWNGPFAALPQAEVGVISMAMQSVGFTLVAEQTGVGREAQLGINAGGDLAAVRLQMGIQVLAVS